MKAFGGKKVSPWAIVVPVALAALLLVFAFRGVDWAALLGTLTRVRPEVYALALLIVTGSLALRALRWRVLLSAEARIPPLTVYWATVLGYLGNNFLPFRAGELVRAAVISRRAPVSMTFALATTLVERVLDVLALVLISLLVFATLPAVPDSLRASVQLTAVLGLAGVLVLLFLPRLERQLRRLVRRFARSEALRERALTLMERFLFGMRAFQHPVRASLFLALTGLIWANDALAAITVANAFGLHLQLFQALLLLAALGLSSAAPSTPGYVGIYQAVAVTVLAPFGFSRNDALAFILAFQAANYLCVLVWGGLGLWRTSLGHHPDSRLEVSTEASVAAPSNAAL